MRYILFNPLATIKYTQEELKSRIGAIDPSKNISFLDVTKTDIHTFLLNIKDGDDVFLCGGDGTLNKLINYVDTDKVNFDIYLYKSGNGNDFLRDIDSLDKDYVLLNPYFKKLPTVKILDKEYKFINGVGFGIDGLVCVEADKMKANGQNDINYTGLSIKLLLTKYKKVKATIEIDGKVLNYKSVFLASAMNGRYYGGGMKTAPDQDRLSDTITLCVWHNFNRLTALMAFPSIFKGEHDKKVKKVTTLSGKHIKVTFDKPTALQIDGESFDNIISYEVTK